MNRVQEYLNKIREINGLSNAILCGITISRRTKTAEFLLVTDKVYTAAEEQTATSISQAFLPAEFTATVKIVKRVPDAAMIRAKIYAFICNTFPAASAFLEEENIQVEMLSSGAHFCMDIASGEQSLFSSGKILDEISKYLQSVFCGSFYGNVRIVEKESRDESILEELPETEETPIAEIRRFPICNFKKIDGADFLPKFAVYLADYQKENGQFAVCGKITFIEERQYVKHNEKTGEDVQKSRYSITLSDGTGMLRTTYFPKKATVEVIKGLKAGDSIVVIGENEEYKGNMSFKASKINFGSAPEGFVPEKRKGKSVPKFYHDVFPEPYVDYTQTGLFDSFEKPSALTDNVFVVFDLETTGLAHQPAMGKMDKIIELGAVKIVNGEMKEKFSTFVACEERLSKEIIDLTDIEDSDLVGAPTVDKVMADFFKFTEGAYLVGHNVNFDYDFVRYYGEQNGYMFDNRAFDTLTLAQELLRGQVAKYTLDTVAGYYGFTFNHHRAFDDACVTAKVFIEFIKKRKSLPL